MNKKTFWQRKNTWLIFLTLLVASVVLAVPYAQSAWFIVAVVFAAFITGSVVISIAYTRER